MSRRWIFILEGLLTIVIAIASYWFIADWPSKAKFITQDEKEYINARLKRDSDATQNEGFSWSNVWLAVKDPKVWLYNAVFHTLSLPLYTLSLFLVSSLFRTHCRTALTEPSHRSSKHLATRVGKLSFSQSLHTRLPQSSPLHMQSYPSGAISVHRSSSHPL